MVVFWQSIVANRYVEMAIDSQFFFIQDELFEIFITTVISGFGLYILGTLDETTQLSDELQTSAEELQSAFGNLALTAATLSHDLKAPIQSQINALEMVKNGHFGSHIETERNQRILQTLTENSLFELELVSNLIALLRYEIKEEQFQPQPFNINDLFLEIHDELQPLVLRKELTLILYPIEAESPIIVADYLSLKRVLHNLIFNAIQHLSHRQHIEVRSHNTAKSWIFTVQDNGPGMPPEVRETLFNQFEADRLQLSTGLGLGLFISKQMVERHGGHIQVQSPPNGGTLIRFTIPQPQLLHIKKASNHLMNKQG